MGEVLSVEEYQKIVDLRRIYGTSGVSEYCRVRRSIIEFILIRIDGEQVAGIRSDAAKRIRCGLRQYWKSWMAKYRLTDAKQ